jgi:20S proteasome subunit beta 4
MDTTFAIKGKDFVLMVSDMTIARSIFKLKETEDKTMMIDDNKLISLAGPIADCKDFGNFL